MRIGIIKPDWRIAGGFEKVVARVENDLKVDGHEVRRFELDVPSLPRQPFGVPIGSADWDRSPEWFAHMTMLDRFRGMNVEWADLVVSTQPPSYAVRHPRHLSLFYHHARIFYDLSGVWIRAGLAQAGLHNAAAEMLRKAELSDFEAVSHFLAGSERVAERLRFYQGPGVPLSLYQAAAPQVELRSGAKLSYVLCVSRHEFTKRTELVVQALAMCHGQEGILAGGGGRLPFVRALAADLADGSVDAAELTDGRTWLNSGLIGENPSHSEHPWIHILGRVGDDQLDELYRGALCIVAPAYDEDDGLTVLEAMAHAKPVIVCRDGGGLTSMVRDGVNGFMVEPTAAGIAAAIGDLAADRGQAVEMGIAGREAVLGRTAQRAKEQLLTAVELVRSGGSRT